MTTTTTITVAGHTVELAAAAGINSERRALFAEIVATVTDGAMIDNSVHGPTRVYASPSTITPVLDELIVGIDVDEHDTAVAIVGSPIAALRALASGQHPNGWPATAATAAAQVLSALQTRGTAQILGDLLAGRPITTDVEAPAALEVGTFVGLGVEQISRGGAEWAVDPDTGCITSPAIVLEVTR